MPGSSRANSTAGSIAGRSRSSAKPSPEEEHSAAVDNESYIGDDDNDDTKSIGGESIGGKSIGGKSIGGKSIGGKSVSSFKSSTSTKGGDADSSLQKKLGKLDKLQEIVEDAEPIEEEISLNEKYIRTRRYDTAGKYRIGPSFITKSRLAHVDENKPAKLKIAQDPKQKSLELGLLTYFWTFTDQHDKQEIDLVFIQSLIDSGCDINHRDEYGQTILHAIVRDWHTDVAVFAIRNDADVNIQDRFGRSPLHLAAALNSVDMAKILLVNGASVDLATEHELQTPMHYAAKYNSLEVIKVFIKFQGSFTQRDANDRTALFLAAEYGSTETAQFLLDIGAPCGIYDSEGNSAISYLVEKMPHVGCRALQQFIISNNALKRSEIYLSYLENNAKGKSGMIAKTPLEVIAIYEDTDLIMHPVIQKAIETKWEFYGKWISLKHLTITLLYMIFWLVLAYYYPDDRSYYEPLSKEGWKIAFEALIILMASYFFYEDVKTRRSTEQYHRAWVERKQHSVRSNVITCHPCWPEDREKLESEIERIRSVPNLARRNTFWFVYECFMLFLIAVIIVTRALEMSINSTELFVAHKFIFGIGLIMSSLRLVKIGTRFRFCSIFLRVTGQSMIAFFQMLFLYLQIYIPFISAFWLMFGGENGDRKIRLAGSGEKVQACNKTLEESTQLRNIFFNVFESSFGQEELFCLSVVDAATAQTLISLFHALATFITLSIFVALVTSKYTTNYNRCVAESSLKQAAHLLNLEKNLDQKSKSALIQYYKKSCNPAILPYREPSDFEHKRNTLSQLRLTERRLDGIENIIRETEERYVRNDNKNEKDMVAAMKVSSEEINNAQNEFSKKVNAILKDAFTKQEFINRYIPKILKTKNPIS